jgi:hypothetical protein
MDTELERAETPKPVVKVETTVVSFKFKKKNFLFNKLSNFRPSKRRARQFQSSKQQLVQITRKTTQSTPQWAATTMAMAIMARKRSRRRRRYRQARAAASSHQAPFQSTRRSQSKRKMMTKRLIACVVNFTQNLSKTFYLNFSFKAK